MAARFAVLFLSAQAVLGLRQRQQRQNSSASCGVRGRGAGARIINGEDAKECDWTWQVQLRFKDGRMVCGGTLISDRWVLTAAHCTHRRPAYAFEVILGNYERVGVSPEASVRSVARLVGHPNYNPRSMRNDVSLIELSSPVELGGCIGVACLPDADAPVPDGTECWITGWGITEFGDYDALPQYLQEANLTTVSKSECKDAYSKEGFKLSEGMLCASGQVSNGEYSDACHGDYGGPMVCQMDGAWYLHGTSSFSYGCAAGTPPGVWAETVHQRSWIKGITGL